LQDQLLRANPVYVLEKLPIMDNNALEVNFEWPRDVSELQGNLDEIKLRRIETWNNPNSLADI